MSSSAIESGSPIVKNVVYDEVQFVFDRLAVAPVVRSTSKTFSNFIPTKSDSSMHATFSFSIADSGILCLFN